MTDRSAVLLLAAGASTRLGTPKQLVRFRGETLLRRAARHALRCGAERVHVVLGCGAESLRAELDGLEVLVATNAGWREGIASSIRTGLAAALTTCPPLEAALVTLVDQPLVTGEHLRALLELRRTSGALVVAASYGSVAGVPAVFDRASFPRLLALRGSGGAREVIADTRARRTVAIPEAALDIDVPADLSRLSGRVGPARAAGAHVAGSECGESHGPAGGIRG